MAIFQFFGKYPSPPPHPFEKTVHAIGVFNTLKSYCEEYYLFQFGLAFLFSFFITLFHITIFRGLNSCSMEIIFLFCIYQKYKTNCNRSPGVVEKAFNALLLLLLR